MPTVWLIRHGESAANAGLATADPASAPLTPRGREQADCVARAFAVVPALVITSPYVRARQTAELTMVRFPGAPIEEWPLQEFNYLARFAGMATTVRDRAAAVADYWERADPWYQDGPTAESFAAFVARVRAGVERLRGLGDAFVAVFTHEFVIRAVYWTLLPYEPAITPARMRFFLAMKPWLALPNACIAPLTLDERGGALLGAPSAAHLPPHLITGLPGAAAGGEPRSQPGAG